MDSHSVRQNLEQLRAALESGAPLDDTLKQELAALDADIRRAIEGGEAPGGLMGRATGLSLRFAEQHPTVAAVLRELGVLLEGIGA